MKSQKNTSQPKLFPFALINNNVEGLNARHHNRSGIIYTVVVIALILTAASLPFITVDVSSRSRGMIRPATDNNSITAAAGGLIVESKLIENARVCQGDTLLVLSSEEMNARAKAISQQLMDNQQYTSDAQVLLNSLEDFKVANSTLNSQATNYPSLSTELYQKEYARYRQEIDQALLKLTHAKRQLERQTQLLAAGSISKMEQEQSHFDEEMARAALDNIQSQRKQLWAQELSRYRREKTDLQGELAQIQQRARQYVVTAPITGVINQVTGVQPGNFVSPGQAIATIAPDDNLQVEVFVSPSDIGLIQKGMQAQFQIDAYHHNRWGMATGSVEEIATDIIEMGQQPIFLVKCKLDQRQLHLKNGYAGRFKPGMSLTAHFTLTKRSLYELLHDKVDDWLNPAASPIANN
ncbi:MAG: HlyD family efflux transporter periplasmic adaptor subunit [Bacteroidota bacterium]